MNTKLQFKILVFHSTLDENEMCQKYIRFILLSSGKFHITMVHWAENILIASTYETFTLSFVSWLMGYGVLGRVVGRYHFQLDLDICIYPFKGLFEDVGLVNLVILWF